ncbi:MAG TPA: hypothetical protein VKB09_02285 [Thermomicrobiales bacterium]|nr:hypothetical protein [Thermomicrobiales bacterium]
MATQLTVQPDPITVDDETNLDRLLDKAANKPVRLERNGVVYRLAREEADPWAGYDPERVRDGLRRYAGTLTQAEGERLKEQIYRSRDEGTRPINRP